MLCCCTRWVFRFSFQYDTCELKTNWDKRLDSIKVIKPVNRSTQKCSNYEQFPASSYFARQLHAVSVEGCHKHNCYINDFKLLIFRMEINLEMGNAPSLSTWLYFRVQISVSKILTCLTHWCLRQVFSISITWIIVWLFLQDVACLQLFLLRKVYL